MKTYHFPRVAHFAWLVLLLLVSAPIFSQKVVNGMVVDSQSGDPIVGATIIQAGTTNGTVSDFDGNFSLKVESLPADFEITFLGYQSVKTTATRSSVGKIQLAEDSKALADVVVKSSIAVARKTPIALSSISPQIIEERLGGQELPEILKSTPGVHANKQGGGYGDSEIYMRGFDNTNVAMMVNGVPMNDMENGTVYWCNWAGLGDVAASIQSQRGLGASKVSSPSVGGTLNIITKGLDAHKGGFVSYALGNDNANKVLFSISTGFMANGLAITLLGGKSWGNGHAQGMEYEGYNYFFSINKRFNDQHQLGFSIFGAPQKHNQRSSYSALTLSQWKYVEKIYGIKDYRFNAAYGFDKNGNRMLSDYNVYHKPQLSLNHQWQINEKSNLSTALYASFGRGCGYSGEANGGIGAYSYTDFRGANYGKLQTTYRKSDGTFDFGAMQEINENSDHGSAFVMSESKNYHNWYGLLSTFTTNFLDCIDFYGGVDFRYYVGKHTNEIIDLMNGDYYIDPDRKSVNSANNKAALDPSWVNEKLHVGDVIYRNYDGHVVQEGAFFQAEYNKNDLSAFIAGSLSNTSYWRYDKFYYDEDNAKSEVMNYIGFTVKAGANYNINDNHNVFVNVGHISRAPKFSYGAFMQATNSNASNPDAKNEKILSFELGYGFKSSIFEAKLNGYFTKWLDKTMTKSGQLGDTQETFYMNMTGVHAVHKGIELELVAPLAKWVELTGMVSLGDWKWDSNATGYAYDEHGNAMTQSGTVTQIKADDHAWSTINLKGIRVGGSAQTTAAAGANFSIESFRIGFDWTLAARNYAYYSLSGSNLSLGKSTTIAEPWEVPVSNSFDLHASYRFEFGKVKATLSGNVNNLLNSHHIVKAWNPSSGTVDENSIYCFFDTGRMWTARLKVNF